MAEQSIYFIKREAIHRMSNGDKISEDGNIVFVKGIDNFDMAFGIIKKMPIAIEQKGDRYRTGFSFIECTAGVLKDIHSFENIKNCTFVDIFLRVREVAGNMNTYKDCVNVVTHTVEPCEIFNVYSNFNAWVFDGTGTELELEFVPYTPIRYKNQLDRIESMLKTLLQEREDTKLHILYKKGQKYWHLHFKHNKVNLDGDYWQCILEEPSLMYYLVTRGVVIMGQLVTVNNILENHFTERKSSKIEDELIFKLFENKWFVEQLDWTSLRSDVKQCETINELYKN